MRDRTRRALPRRARVALAGGLLMGVLGVVAGAAVREWPIAPTAPLEGVLEFVLEALRSVTGRAAVTGVTALLAGSAAVLAWRPAREDVTASLVERWAVLGAADELGELPTGGPAALERSTGPRSPALHGS